jgi:threonine synthase
VAGRANIDIFMLHPAGRVTEIQRRQMTTVLAPNVLRHQPRPVDRVDRRQGMAVGKGAVVEHRLHQRLRVATVLAPNVHNIAIEGNFDDAQALVKAMFNDRAFADRGRPMRAAT